MALNNIRDTARNAQVDGFTADLNLGSTNPGARIEMYTAGFVTLLATLEYSNPPYGNATGGTATANAITDESSAPNSGTAEVFRHVDRDGTLQSEGTVGTSGEDINLNTNIITAGDIVSITSATLTAPAA